MSKTRKCEAGCGKKARVVIRDMESAIPETEYFYCYQCLVAGEYGAVIEE